MYRSFTLALAGGFVLFFWQFLSHAGLNLHGPAQRYTPHGEEIMALLAPFDLEEGTYALTMPAPADRADQEKMAAFNERMEGRPWAVLNYQKVWTADMSMNLLRGFLINALTAALLFWMLRRVKGEGLRGKVLLSVGLGWLGFLYFPYINFIWFRNPDIWAYLLDATVPFALLGWMGHRWG